MFKFTHVFLFFGMLVAAAQASDQCCSDIQKSQTDLKSDVKALQDLVQDLRTRLGEQIEKSSPSQNVQRSWSPTARQSKVAFFVGLSKSVVPVTHNIDLVFDNVVTNKGSAYSAWSGRFTAPFSATYQFSVTVAAVHTKQGFLSMVKSSVHLFK